MAGNKAGAAKSVAKILAANPNHFREIGRMGGQVSRGGGFMNATPEQRREWGRQGGLASRRKAVSE